MTMKTPAILIRHFVLFWALWAALAPPIVQANEVDDQGRLIAAPMETDLVERGYLFYPLRVLPKPQPTAANLVLSADDSTDSAGVQSAPVSQNAPMPAAPLPQTAVPVTPPAPVAAAPLPKPTAASVLIQRMEPIKAAPLPVAKNMVDDSHSDAGRDAAEPAKPAMSKAEMAKAERAKAAQERAEKRKLEQAKAALDREEKRKAQKAKAEQWKAEQAKAAQERAEKLKQEQAKAELARAERVRAAALAKVDRALEELARAEKIKEALVRAELSKAETAKAQAVPAETAKAEETPSEAAKAEDIPAVATKPETTTAEATQVDGAQIEPDKSETVQKDSQLHGDSHAIAAPVGLTAGQKILVINAAKGQAAAADH